MEDSTSSSPRLAAAQRTTVMPAPSARRARLQAVTHIAGVRRCPVVSATYDQVMTPGVGSASVTFGERVQAAVAEIGPLCVGVDPTPALLSQWGLPDTAGSVAAFGDACVRASAGLAAVVKPQVALYERHGARGFAVLETFIAQAHAAGLLVVADAKRGDGVASSAAGYADAWLRTESPLCVDAVTVTAYSGLGALAPMVQAARDTGNGVIVVVRSSDPEGASVQDCTTPTGVLPADTLLAEIAALNEAETDGKFLGSVGSS